MTITERYLAYADAFEGAFASDDWTKVAPFFTENAVYNIEAEPPLGGRYEGRAAILDYFKQVLDDFDRRFEGKRELEVVAGPEEKDGTVWIRWAATYHAAGAPPLRMEGEERAIFAGERIQRLEDRIPASENERVAGWLAAHGTRLKS